MFAVTDVYVVWLTLGGEWISVFKLILGGTVILSAASFYLLPLLPLHSPNALGLLKVKSGICLKIED